MQKQRGTSVTSSFVGRLCPGRAACLNQSPVQSPLDISTHTLFRQAVILLLLLLGTLSLVLSVLILTAGLSPSEV